MKKIKVFSLVLFPILVLFFSLLLGSSEMLSLSELIQHLATLFQKTIAGNELSTSSNIETILWNIRLPRVLLTFLVGASLSISGSVLQALFRNPIVDPFSLGISSGAAFGASLAMIFPLFSVSFSAFFFGVLAVGITYAVSYAGSKTSIVTIVLSGMIITGVFTALLTVLQYISDPYKLQAIIQWTMGNLHTASWAKLNPSAYIILLGMGGIILFRWRLNLLALGDQEALAVGVNPRNSKLLIVGLATLITSISVAMAGMISLFGLIIPHIVRMLFGANNQIGVLANISIGGSFLLLIDNFSRTILPFEVPIGVFTMLLGAPLFIYLLRKNLTHWNL